MIIPPEHNKSVDLLITDYCNQSCPFCFAKEEMKLSIKKELSFKDLQMITHKLKKYGVTGVNVLGGEPTLHSQFPKIFSYLLKNFLFITIASNGIFSDKIAKYLKTLPPQYSLQFNISTPSFIFNKEVRNKVLDRIKELVPYTSIGISITDHFMNTDGAKKVLDYIDSSLLKQLVVRVSVQQSVVGEGNIFHMKDLPRIGNNLYTVIRDIEKKGPPRFIFSPKGLLTPCMFTSTQRTYLQKKRLFETGSDSFRCHSYPWLFKINSSMTTFQCYPLSTIDRFQLTEKTSLDMLVKKFDTIHDKYQKETVLNECKTCPFFGHGPGKCPGPCLGFRMNELKIQEAESLSHK